MERGNGGPDSAPDQQIIIDHADIIHFDYLIGRTLMHCPRGLNKLRAPINTGANSIKIYEVISQKRGQIVIPTQIESEYDQFRRPPLTTWQPRESCP